MDEEEVRKGGVGHRRTGGDNARTGGRSERVVRDVLSAVAKELARVGYAALRIEDVASFAGVNKTTIYRRWPTKADLVGSALRALHEARGPTPDTGHLEQDLRLLAGQIVEKAKSPEARGIARMVMAELDHPDVEALARSLRSEHLRPWFDVLRRGMARGELPKETDLGLVTEMIASPIVHRVYRLRESVDEAYIARLVRIVLRGFRP